MKEGTKASSQNGRILKYLDKHKEGITPMDALKYFGCFRLSARIHDLRDKGYEIKTIKETKKNAEGNVCNYARYVLVKGAK